jgi:hypothetical protein
MPPLPVDSPVRPPVPPAVRDQIVRLLRAYRPGITTAVLLLSDGGPIPETVSLTQLGAGCPVYDLPESERSPRTALRVWAPGLR